MTDFAIGDISGYKDAFDLLIKQVSNARIVAMGDIIDRGPQSSEMIQFFIDHPEHVCLMGNHEHMFIKAYEEVMENKRSPYFTLIWIFINGGQQTLESYGINFPKMPFTKEALFDITKAERTKLMNLDQVKEIFAQFNKIPKDHIDKLKSLPMFLETETHFFSHAPINNWKNSKLFEYKEFENSDYFLDVGCLWNRKYPDKPRPDSKFLVYGHQNESSVLNHTVKHPTGKLLHESKNLLEDSWGVCLDTAKAGYLTGFKTTDHTLYYQPIK